MNFFLPTHVHFCGYGDAIVFLDLKRDEYAMILSPHAPIFRSLLPHDTSISTSDSADRESGGVLGFGEPMESALDELVARGLLTRDGSAGRIIAPTCTAPPVERLVESDAAHRERLQFGDVCKFFASCVVAAARLRVQSIEAIVRSIKTRKALRANEASHDFDKARRLVVTFTRLRSLFPADYLCLYDSLALLEFLGQYNIYPSWIFAVKLQPWEAHCWVQDGGVVFNEGVEEVLDYVPIMVV